MDNSSLKFAHLRLSKNIRWGYIILGITGILVIAVLIYMAFLLSASKKTIHFTPADIVYGEKIHAVQDMGLVTYPQNTFDLPNNPASKPVIRLSEQFYDFGVADAHQVLTRTFVIANQGNSTLIIKQVYTTCGCIIGDFTAAEIPPGKVVLMTLQFDTGFHDMRGTTVRRGVIIETNDSDHPVQEIWIQASIK